MKYVEIQRLRKQAGWLADLKDKVSDTYNSWTGGTKNTGEAASAEYNQEAADALANSSLGKKYLDRMSGAEWGWTGVGGLVGGGAGYLLSKLIHRKASLANRLLYTLGGAAAGAGGANVLMRNVRSSAYGNRTLSESLRLNEAKKQLNPEDRAVYEAWLTNKKEPTDSARWIMDAIGAGAGGALRNLSTKPAAELAKERANAKTKQRVYDEQTALNKKLNGDISLKVETLNGAMSNEGLNVDQVRDPSTVKDPKKQVKARALNAQLTAIESELGKALGAQGSQTLSATRSAAKSGQRFTVESYVKDPVATANHAADVAGSKAYAKKMSPKSRAIRTATGAGMGVGAVETTRALVNWWRSHLRDGEGPIFAPATAEQREQREQLVRDMNK